MAKKGKTTENEVFEGITAGKTNADYTTEEMMELLGGGRTTWTKKGKFKTLSELDETALAGYESYLDWRLNLDARDYNSVGSQVKRLMDAGMSRTQALLTATAGEATPPVTSDMATALNEEKTRKRDTAMQILGTFQQLLGNAQDFVNGYDNFQQIRGDALIQPIGEEIYSWLPRGIQVPDLARADAQHFKEWCLGMLKDNNGNIIEPPQEAKDLIKSRAWAKMASQPSGWLAFERYFNANYSTRGYHEDWQDAVRMRRLSNMDLVLKRFDAMLQEPAVIESSVYMMMQDMSGLTLHEVDSANWETMLKGYDHFEMDGEEDFGISVVNGQFQFSEDAPELIQAVFDEFNERVATAAWMNSPQGAIEALEDLRKDRKMNLFAKYCDNIIKTYEKNNLQFEAEHQASGQQLYNQYVPEWLQHLREFRNAWKKLGNSSNVSSSGSSADGKEAAIVESVGDKVVKSKAIKGAVHLGKALITKIP